MSESDNPIMEPADVFYQTTEDAELIEPTEDEAVTSGDDQSAEDESLESTDQPEDTEGSEPDEDTEEKAEEDDTEDTESEGEELVYLDLDGKEVDLEDVRKWRDGHLMQADYTRKTQELADDRKALKVEIDEIAATKAGLADAAAELQALIAEDEEVNWEELREDDPEEYIKLKERADKRKTTAEKFKTEASLTPVSKEEIATEQAKLFEMNPTWIDSEGNQTEAMKADSDMLAEYWKANDFTMQDVKSMVLARHIETCLKAAKFDELQEKSKKFVKKAKTATLVTKPKAQARKLKTKPKALEDVFYKS